MSIVKLLIDMNQVIDTKILLPIVHADHFENMRSNKDQGTFVLMNSDDSDWSGMDRFLRLHRFDHRHEGNRSSSFLR